MAKTLKVNKIAMRSFSQYLLFNISFVRNWVNNPDKKVVMSKYICYITTTNINNKSVAKQKSTNNKTRINVNNAKDFEMVKS